MISSLTKFGVQSYCFRDFKDNRSLARAVRDLGLDRIELCGLHGDFARPSVMREVAKLYRDEGVQIVSLGVQMFTGDDHERVWLESAVEAGAHHLSAHVRVDSFGAALSKMRKWAREFNLRLGLHCHGGYMFGGSPDELEFLLGLGGPEVGLCLDTAWALQIGPVQGNPVAWVRRFAGSLYAIHLKDFVFRRDGSWEDTVIGEGNLPLPEFFTALSEVGFGGELILEYEGDPQDPVPALRRCVEAVRKVAAA